MRRYPTTQLSSTREPEKQMKLKEYEVNVQFKVALYDNHDQTRIALNLQEAMSKAVFDVCKDSYPPMLPSQTSTTITEKTNA